MSKEIKRLQGPEWYAKKDSLLMTKYRINEKGHIKGTYTDMEGNLYSHWFSNKEAEEFKEQEKEEEIIINNIGNYKVGVRPNGSLSMYHIPDEEEIRQRFFETHKKIDQAKGPDCTNISLNIPTISDLDIERSIDNVLSSEEYMKQINDLVLEDEKERYVRALLNRISKAITVLEEGIEFCKNDSQGVYDKCNMAIKREEKVIAILKGEKHE